ncbi:MAG TPA: uridine diphosphate-N-acetylglucosamine-binding protein YvcK [Candidatus Magasanikbacteria bacterium]|nr:uridine diphosphate-N-acetylglucosamine-binding protein YvcK [Candidatus Magasanikbacteria bacterium]
MNEVKKKIKVVTVGGGNGSAISLGALKKILPDIEIKAAVSTSDSGGSSGDLRREFATLPPGDILRAVLALAPFDYRVLKKIFHSNRFTTNQKLFGHNLGNLVFVLLEQYAGDFIAAIRAFEEIMESVGHVYPSTLNFTDLAVELTDGSTLVGETEIDRPSVNQTGRIKRAWLSPRSEIYSETASALREADYIIIGPGSLYTSVIAAMLPDGFREAVNDSKAKLIFVAGNAYEANGEMGPRILSESVRELQTYLPRKIDMVICNNHLLTDDERGVYTRRGWAAYDFDYANIPQGSEVVSADFERSGGGLCPDKLGEIFKKILWK